VHLSQRGAEATHRRRFSLLHDVFHRFRAVLQTAVADDEGGLAVMEARALGFIAHHPGATPSDIVKRSGRDKAQVARLLAELAGRGLVARGEGADRRSHTLHLTPEGKAAHRRIDRRRLRAAATMFASFSREERATLARLLGRLVDAPEAPPPRGR
jgi:DNA-binding MarR family transcriptional regulator